MNLYYLITLVLAPLFPPTDGAGSIVTFQVDNLIVINEDTLFAKQYFYGDDAIHNFIKANRVVDFESETNCTSTSCYRDYIVIWRLIDRRLYLQSFLDCCTLESIDMAYVFGDQYIPEKGIPAGFINGDFPISNTNLTDFLFDVNSNDITITFRRGKLKRKELSRLGEYLEMICGNR